jgi:ubiquinone/menaquinone biosynthesis C-methylase UbiE
VRILILSKKILDACCGSKMFWFDKEHPDVIYADNRKESHILCDQRELIINPDIISDFRNMPFQDNSFKLVVFDPPHLRQIGDNSWMKKKYGSLGPDWKEDINKGFKECMRVLEPYGVLIFKWSEVQITVNEIINVIDTQPLFGHKSGKKSNTHWLCFMKQVGSTNNESN